MQFVQLFSTSKSFPTLINQLVDRKQICIIQQVMHDIAEKKGYVYGTSYMLVSPQEFKIKMEISGVQNEQELEAYAREIIKKCSHALQQTKDCQIPKITVELSSTPHVEKSAGMVAHVALREMLSRVSLTKILNQLEKTVKTDPNVIGFRFRIAGRLQGAEMASSKKITYGKYSKTRIRTNSEYAKRYIVGKYGVYGAAVRIVWNDKPQDEQEKA